MKGVKYAVAEGLGVAALLMSLSGHLLLMGAEIVSGAGVILMFVSVVGYVLLTWLSDKRSSDKAYWILYGSKIAFIGALLLFAPLISKVLGLSMGDNEEIS